MKSNREAIMSMDFFWTWVRAIRHTPWAMVKITVVVVLALCCVSILRFATWLSGGVKRGQ